MIELVFATALSVAAAIAPGYVNGANVSGPRPAPEVRQALASVAAALAQCANAGPSELFIELEVIAAGFVDRAQAFATVGAAVGAALDAPVDALDEGCVISALRTMVFSDRGIEPATHVIVHLVSGDSPAEPTPQQIGQALENYQDDFERCVAIGRRTQPTLGGSVVLAFTVAKNGDATVHVSGGSLKSQAVNDCIVRELGQVHFEGAAEGFAAWPLFFARPSLPKPAARIRNDWQSPTLLDFFGCGSAFPTS